VPENNSDCEYGRTTEKTRKSPRAERALQTLLKLRQFFTLLRAAALLYGMRDGIPQRVSRMPGADHIPNGCFLSGMRRQSGKEKCLTFMGLHINDLIAYGGSFQSGFQSVLGEQRNTILNE